MTTENKTTESSSQELFKAFIQNKYNTFGAQQNLIMRTSRELAYDCRELCEPSLPDINIVMVELGYEAQPFMGSSAWVLYEKDIDNIQY